MTTVKIVEDHFPAIRKGMEQNTADAVRDTIEDIRSRVKAEMSKPKTGRIYRRPNGRQHQASAPGEAPAIDTTALINSIQTQMLSRTRGVVYTDREYAPVLEFGGARIAPRPAFIPATKAAWPEFIRRMTLITGK